MLYWPCHICRIGEPGAQFACHGRLIKLRNGAGATTDSGIWHYGQRIMRLTPEPLIIPQLRELRAGPWPIPAVTPDIPGVSLLATRAWPPP